MLPATIPALPTSPDCPVFRENPGAVTQGKTASSPAALLKNKQASAARDDFRRFEREQCAQQDQVTLLILAHALTRRLPYPLTFTLRSTEPVG